MDNAVKTLPKLHFSKVLFPFLTALALARDTDNDNDNNDVANSSPNNPAVGDASLTRSMMAGSTNAANTGDSDDDDDDNDNENSSMSPTMNMMSSTGTMTSAMTSDNK
ncbi:hypothetical protein XPA_006848 [Xanthoria parietina]